MAPARGRARVLAVVLACALAASAPVARAADLPSFAAVQAAWRSSETTVVDRRGLPLQTVRTDLRQRRQAWVSLARVSPAFPSAVLLSEDRRFADHSGVDWTALGSAAWQRLRRGGDAGRARGASTLTMQLAGLLDPGLAPGRGGRDPATKLAQMRRAWQLERAWTKPQILEAYLNLAPFRGDLVGIGAVAAGLFQKDAGGLDAVESAIAAALLRSPNAAPADVAHRACGLLSAQGRAADCTLVTATTAGILRPRRFMPEADDALAPHLGRRLVAAARVAPGAAVRTTLDADVQRVARDALHRTLVELRGHHVDDGAVIAIDNASGDVLAWVGGSGALSRAPEVDHVLARRQAGSTLKPFLYALAIESHWLTAASVLDDTPLDVGTTAGLYVPDDYDHRFRGPVSVRTALGASLNVPAVRTLMLVTPERFATRLRALDLPLAHDGGYYGTSLALGSAEVTLASLANAYRTLANAGRASPLRIGAGDPAVAPHAAMSAEASWIVADILADREARVTTFGLDNALSPRYRALVKTGTSKDMRDNWCVGASSRYTVGVWVGNSNGEPMWDVSGVTGAAPVWRAVLDALQQGTGAGPAPLPPPGVVQQRIRYEPAIEPPRDEWFASGTQASVVRPADARGSASTLIASPVDGAIVALDPDIPVAAQRLRFALAGDAPVIGSWRLDGKRLGAAAPTRWPLWPGRHLLEFVDAAGRVQDRARFEVRGAAVRPTGTRVSTR